MKRDTLKPSRDPFMEVSQNLSPLDGSFLVIFFKIFIHTQSFGLWSRRYTQKDNFGFVGGYPVRFKIPDVETHNAWIEKASIKIDTQNGMTSFLVLSQRNQALN
jgi:hypothetical protein